MQNQTVSILGCGWLGLPLAKALIKKGFIVKGSTTAEEHLEQLRTEGIEPYILNLSPELEGDEPAEFLESETLIVNFPPERRSDIAEYHVQQFSSLIDALQLSPVRTVLLVSSTSVYPMLNREVTEEDADSGSAGSAAGEALLLVEEMLMQERSFQTSVVRFCGLVGYDRSPANYLGRMAELSNPGQPMNLIHRDDCINIITEIIRLGQWGEVFNACSPGHPSRIDYYSKAAEIGGIELPPVNEGGEPSPFKIISSSKLEGALNYRFIHPDPLQSL
ncbi:epimerase [Chlorobium phaeovibrioides]|uniref:SDR family NAD(P)-dependent oxidoreductase n=2 Tax=Chlorobium phaeovibrioides TaxID=1094 RepID=A0ABW9UQZ0_CHLPH|nr:epimerase [Chlorobium phaeovibrioides]MWV53876.1 SDR family NAD(P)-dependent oxidoreductase [Chlorobium phaeovibrioides]HCD35911.1 NAD(P)-dependent oxidoreductase [Chlorobium sp.]